LADAHYTAQMSVRMHARATVRRANPGALM